MNTLPYFVSFAMTIIGLGTTSPPSAAVADITGTWELTIHYPPPAGDYLATYILKQDGKKITGTYQGAGMCEAGARGKTCRQIALASPWNSVSHMYGPADVTGTIKAGDVVLSVTVKGSEARFTGKVSSPTIMNGTMKSTSDQPRTWSAEKKMK